MTNRAWEALRLPQLGDGSIWELFHENSRVNAHDHYLPDAAVAEHIQALWESLPYANHPRFELPRTLAPMRRPLLEAILARTTARAMEPALLTRTELATLLHCGYGVTRDNAGTDWPRPFRTVPSGGALYPLELYLHTAFVDDLPPGLYHYNPSRNDVCLLREGDLTPQINQGMVFSDVAGRASLLIFITAVMERSTFKYGNRGYRFMLLEAGHVAQNISLACVGLQFGSINIGGFYEHAIDELIGLDGVRHATVYMLGVGRQLDDGDAGEAREPPKGLG